MVIYCATMGYIIGEIIKVALCYEECKNNLGEKIVMRGKNNFLLRAVSVALATVLLVANLNYSTYAENEILNAGTFQSQAEQMCLSGSHVKGLAKTVKEPTATEPGEREYSCIYCGKLLEEEIIPVVTKRERPQAIFDTKTYELTNIPDNSTVAINGIIITNISNGTALFSDSFNHTGDYIITVIANENGGLAQSDMQAIFVHKPDAPFDIQQVPAKAYYEQGLISGVNSDMEFSYQNSAQWVTCAESGMAAFPGVYKIRYKATQYSVASDPFTIEVRQEGNKKPNTPTAVFDSLYHQIKNLIPVPKQQETPAPSKKAEKKEETVQKPKAPEKVIYLDNDGNVKKEEDNVPPKTEIIVEKDDDIKKKEEAVKAFDKVKIESSDSWNSIFDMFGKTDAPVIVDIKNSSMVPADVFVKAAETNTHLVLSVGDGTVWSVAPSDIDARDVAKHNSINLGIVNDMSLIPRTAISTVQGDGKQVTQIFEIMHNGAFGFGAQLTIRVNAEAGKYANLFCYDNNDFKMKYIDSSVVNERGEATFTMTHASSYAIIISDEPMSQADVRDIEVEQIVSENDENAGDDAAVDGSQGVAINSGKGQNLVTVAIIIFIIILALAAVLTVVYIRNKKKGDNK